MTAQERENAAIFLRNTSATPFVWLQGSYRCFYCKNTFTELQPALQHVRSHDIPDKKDLLENYIKSGKRVIKVDISDLNCRLCQSKHIEIDDMRTHLINDHQKEFEKAGNGLMAYNLSNTNGSVSCSRCGVEFSTFFALNRHMNVHENVVCEICGLGFMTHHRLRSHRNVHQTGTHKCDRCHKVFLNKLKLRYHIVRYHEGTNVKKSLPQKCPLCLQRFAEYHRKLVHMKEIHGITMKYECSSCKAVFTSKRGLTEHTRKVHLQNIACKICGKCFGSYVTLKHHTRGHTGERNFFCAVCQKTYMHEKQLRKHMKTHGFVVTCLLCGHGFLEKADLNKHIKQWHPDKSKTTGKSAAPTLVSPPK